MKFIFTQLRALLFVSVCALLFGQPRMIEGAAVGDSMVENQVRILESSQDSILFELNIADFAIHFDETSGTHRVTLAGATDSTTPNQPQIPIWQELIAIPGYVMADSIEGVELTILDIEDELLPGRFQLPIIPSLQPAHITADSIFDDDSFTVVANSEANVTPIDDYYPVSPAQLGTTGLLREQTVQPVNLHPVQVNSATGELRINRRIRVRLTWDRNDVHAAALPKPTSPYFEESLSDSILNYADLNRHSAVSAATVGSAPESSLARTSQTTTDTLKIAVDQTGFQRLTYVDLETAAFALDGLDPRRFQLTSADVPQAIWITGEEDGSFDSGDEIHFYGQALDTIYTDQNIYWLTVGDAPGLRMEQRDVTTSTAGPSAEAFLTTHRAETNNHYWQTMPNGGNQDRWFWGARLTAPETRQFTVPLPSVAAQSLTAKVNVHLKGRTDNPSQPDHHTKIYLNGIEIDDQFWDGFATFTHTVTISQSLLVSGDNIFAVESVGDTGASVDQIFVNWIDVGYWHTYTASDDLLYFAPPAMGLTTGLTENVVYDLDGFTTNGVNLFDISVPAAPIKLINASVDGSANSYAMRFEDVAPQAGYAALSTNQFRTPRQVTLGASSEWNSPNNGADYILITHSDFYTRTLPLSRFRADQGLRVSTVLVEEIYNEFNHGISDPQAIRDFLTYAFQSWTAPAPAFVLLVGDATIDYRDRLGTGSINYVPTQIIQTELLGETPSDNWFALASGEDVLPDMYIGRLSAQTPQQVEDIVHKLIAYEQNPPSAAWKEQILFVADDDSASYAITSDNLAATLPSSYVVNRVELADYTEGDNSANDINGYLDNGQFLTNYTGHGSTKRWGIWGDNNVIYHQDDVQNLTTADRLTIVTTANCLNGLFAGHQTVTAIAEDFQRLPNRGAVAVWAPSNLFYPSAHRAILVDFYTELFQKPTVTLGAATTNAKISAYAQSSGWDELVEAFILFGDPATSLEAVLPEVLPTPTTVPTKAPTIEPTVTPTVTLTTEPTVILQPSATSSNEATRVNTPDIIPSVNTAVAPTGQPTGQPTATPANAASPTLLPGEEVLTPKSTLQPTLQSTQQSTPVATTLLQDTAVPTDGPTPVPTASAPTPVSTSSTPTASVPTASVPTVTATPPLSGENPSGEESSVRVFLPLTSGGQQ